MHLLLTKQEHFFVATSSRTYLNSRVCQDLPELETGLGKEVQKDLPELETGLGKEVEKEKVQAVHAVISTGMNADVRSDA